MVMAESERAHATMSDEEARLRKAVETARVWLSRMEHLYDGSDGSEDQSFLDDAQEAYDNAVHALTDAGYKE